MKTRSRPRRSGFFMGAATTALTLAAILTTPVTAETTHEANVAAAAIAAAAPSALTAEAVLAHITDADGVIRFDIAEDGSRFVWADAPVFDDGLAAHGATYLSQGYIYPDGTLSEEVDGVNADGAPQFPEKVLGEWSSYGWYIGDGAHATDGPWVLSTQLYQFGSKWGGATLISEGYVLANTGGTVERAIIGGTGPFATVRGEVRDTTLGVNETEGGNSRYEVHLMGTVNLLFP